MLHWKWGLSALPLKQYGFSLIDVICVRYIVLHHQYYHHTVCGKILPCSMPLAAHIMLSQLSGTIQNLNACLMMEVYHDVQVELYTNIPCLVRLCDTTQQWLMIIPEWTAEHLNFGGTLITGPILMFVFSCRVSPCSVVMDWLWCSLEFSLLYSSITCIQGSWSC